MTTQTRAWKPLFENDTVNAAVTGTSAFLAFPKSPFGVRTVRIANIGGAVTFVELVESAATAASPTTSIPILPNTVAYFTAVNDEVGLAFVGTAANTIYLTMGEGKT